MTLCLEILHGEGDAPVDGKLCKLLQQLEGSFHFLRICGSDGALGVCTIDLCSIR